MQRGSFGNRELPVHDQPTSVTRKEGATETSPVVTKLWMNRRVSEGGDQTEEVTPTVKNVTMTKKRRLRSWPRGFVTREVVVTAWPLQGRHIQITVDSVLRARGKMMKNMAYGAADCLVTGMLQCYQWSLCSRSRIGSRRCSKGSVEPQRRPPCVSQEARRHAREGTSWLPCDRTFECVLQMVFGGSGESVARRKGADRMEELARGAERGVNRQHVQALVTKQFQRQWEWQEDRRTDLLSGFHRHNTAFIRGQTVCGIEDSHLDRSPRTLDGCSVSRDAGCLGIRETEFRYSKCLSQGGVEAPGHRGQPRKSGRPEAGEKSLFVASSSCGLGSGNAGNTVKHREGVRREPQSSTIPTPLLIRNH